MSKAYVPPHKRKDASVSLKAEDFPSLAGNIPVRAGAGGPTYVSKAITPLDSVENIKEEKAVPMFVGKAFKPTVSKEKYEEKFVEYVSHLSNDGWETKEAKSSKKIKIDSDWDADFEY